MSQILERAREYEKKYKYLADGERPSFHATGAIGWINDPNGFSVYKGEYHLFQQYHPYSLEWGPMHWGHMKSKDLIKWEWLPVALGPDQPYDKDGCYSGTALEMEDGRQLLIYTGVEKHQTDSGEIEYEQQCIAIGDGINYEKIPDNPVITRAMLPEGASSQDFRDPKIWKDKDGYYVVAANRAADGSGAILLYKSMDAIHWSFVSTLAECKYEYGTMWECPDFFNLSGKHILMLSPMEMKEVPYEFLGGNGVIAMLGNFDREKGRFQKEEVYNVDYGLDFYAPETLLSPDGRRIMIGWMRCWATSGYKREGEHFYGAMSLPREWELAGGRLLQRPVRELENYRTQGCSYRQIISNEELCLEGVRGRCFDMQVEVSPVEKTLLETFTIELAKDDSSDAKLIYQPKKHMLTIDRQGQSGNVDACHIRSFYVSEEKDSLKLRIIMDKDSVEVFINDGEKVASFILFGSLSADEILFRAEGLGDLKVDFYEIKI